MIFASLVPHAVVWDGFTALENQAYVEIQYGHRTLIVQPLSATQAQIVRLLSPDPYDYTHPQLAPGMLIDYVPTWGDSPT